MFLLGPTHICRADSLSWILQSWVLQIHQHNDQVLLSSPIFVGWVPDRQIVSYLLHLCHSIFQQRLPFNIPDLNVTLARGGKFAKLSLDNSDVDFALRTSLDDGLMAGGGKLKLLFRFSPVGSWRGRKCHSWSRPDLIDTCSKSLPLAISEPFLISLSARPVVQFFNPVSENSPVTGTMPLMVPLNSISLTSSTLNIPTHISWTASIDQTRIWIAGSLRQLH